MATHQVFFSLHFTFGSWLASFESSSYRRKRDISIVWIHYKTQMWAIFFISVVLVDFLSQISQSRVVKWVCIWIFFIGCFWVHGPTPYSVKWCLRTGIPTALQCVHALNTASVPRLFFHNVTIKFTNRLKIEFTNEKNWWERKYERWLDLSIFYFIQWQCT